MKIIFPSLGTFSTQEIREFNTIDDSYEGQAMQFCQQWLSGQQVFTVSTSGSTGVPKPITVYRSQMQASARMTAQALGLAAGDHALVCLNTGYIGGKMMLVRGMELDMDMTVIPPASHPFAGFKVDAHFDFTALVPLQLQQTLADQPEYIPLLNRMKAIIVGGAAVSYPLQTLTRLLKVPVYNTYGMTETVSHIALKRLNGKEEADEYRVLPGVEIAQDTRGCLMIKAPSSNDQWLTTNDLVKLLDAQRFEWLGRVDNVINSGGVKIQVEKVEEKTERVFVELGITARFIVAGLPHELLGQQVTLIIEGAAHGGETETKILTALQNVLDKYEVPRSVRYVSQFAETETGKIDRKRIQLKIRN